MPEVKSVPALLNLIKRIPLPYKKGLVYRLMGKQLAAEGMGWYPVYTGHIWKLDLRNPCHQWMLYDRYADAAFLQWTEKQIPGNGIIVDSGSNIGQFLPYFSKIVPKGKVLAFEPGRELGDWIEACLAENMLPVELIRKGLGSEAFSAFLNSWGEEQIHGLWGQVNEEKGEPIVVERLDAILHERKIDTVDLWKLYVEGYEVQALEGAGDFIANKKIKALYIEMAVKENNHQKIMEFMRKHDYKPYSFNALGKLKPMQDVFDDHMDALFLA